MARMTAAAFAKAVGVSRQAIYKLLKKGRFELYDGMIETSDPAVIEYLRGKGIEKLDEEAVQAAPPAPKKDESSKPPEHKGPNVAKETRRMQLENFRIQQQTLKLKISNDAAAGRLIPRDLVITAVINPMETCQTRMLSDGCQTMAALVHAAVQGGASVIEVEKILRTQLSTFIRAQKRAIGRQLGVRFSGGGNG